MLRVLYQKMKHIRLLIYTERSYLRTHEEYVPLLYPFWGYQLEPENFTDRGRFFDYVAGGETFFGLTNDLSHADFVLSPLAYERERGPESAAYFSRVAKTAKKKVVIFFASDSYEDVDIPNSVIFRTSFYKSQQKSIEYAMPGWSVDFLKEYNNGNLELRVKQKKPVVGYCGYIDRSSLVPAVGLKQNIHRIFKKYVLKSDNTPNFKELRGDAVRYLHRMNGVVANIIIRQKYRAREMSQSIARMQYFENIINSDYTLVVRGAGNFSYRLYEVLSCGRIPIFINTDCVLPFDDIIDWKKHCVWIEEKDVKKLAQLVDAFHTGITNTEFQKLQTLNRELYEQWISPTGFFGNIHRYIVPG